MKHALLFAGPFRLHRSPEMRDAKLRAASAYNAAADFFDAPALSFWNRIGLRTVERMALAPGACVLDACCGSGASAIPAAQAVGAGGRLLGVDLAENLLRLARMKALKLGLLTRSSVPVISKRSIRPMKYLTP